VVEVRGVCDERFASLANEFRVHFDSGLDKGASLAATWRGEPVVDLWAGCRDYDLSEPWEADTVVRVFSSSKPVVMIGLLMLVDRGLLDVDAPIVEYWPDFGRHGKHTITTLDVLLHRSGLPGFGRSMHFDQLRDWDGVMAVVEDAPLWFEPRSASCYHPIIWGFVLAEVARRASGEAFVDFVRRELTEPLGADFHFALDPSQAVRVAALWPPEHDIEYPSEIGRRAFSELSAVTEWADPAYLPVVIPSGSGVTNARALARIGAVIADGGEVDGHRYLSPAAVRRAATEHSFADDLLLGPMRLGFGFGMHSDEFPAPTPTTLHWGGYGGSFLTMDPATGLSCAYAPNQLVIGDGFGDDPRISGQWQRLRELSPDLV
jgi:CubicO group peptidase (beta-lactamase class C family)